MAPIALSPEEEFETPVVETPSKVFPSYAPKPKPTELYPDTQAKWYNDLQENGYVVLKSAIPLNRALAYQQKAFNWVKSFNTPLDLTDPGTFIEENLPIQSKINTFSLYSVVHERWMWQARMEPGILQAFEALWGTEELLVSFDALNITFPNRKDRPRKPAWEHIDQSPFRRGLHCVQGIINLSHSGPEDGGLIVYPGSHKLNDEFFDTLTDKSKWTNDDFYMFSNDELSWYKSHGIKPFKVCAEPGDLILWDSRTAHYGSEPTERSNTIRTAIYAAYTPAKWADRYALETKANIFREFGGTTHWPHDNINVRTSEAKFEDGTLDPRDRKVPLEMPEMSDTLLKLAGVLPY